MANKKKMKEPMLEEVEAIVNSAVYKKIKRIFWHSSIRQAQGLRSLLIW